MNNITDFQLRILLNAKCAEVAISGALFFAFVFFVLCFEAQETDTWPVRFRKLGTPFNASLIAIILSTFGAYLTQVVLLSNQFTAAEVAIGQTFTILFASTFEFASIQYAWKRGEIVVDQTIPKASLAMKLLIKISPFIFYFDVLLEFAQIYSNSPVLQMFAYVSEIIAPTVLVIFDSVLLYAFINFLRVLQRSVAISVDDSRLKIVSFYGIFANVTMFVAIIFASVGGSIFPNSWIFLYDGFSLEFDLIIALILLRQKLALYWNKKNIIRQQEMNLERQLGKDTLLQVRKLRESDRKKNFKNETVLF
ncbi:hypothetical protein HK100_009219 [Physocladia obscura]|uniref:Uncharacterized protein n=1 Tax=Physocladia obscura TaxID=109957 RepID=A0AAD5T592_9FUNG|nr:hypothetical protein HK100_009219 [Physocladia obscura]